MALRDKLLLWLLRGLPGLKAAQAILPTWASTTFVEPTFRMCVQEGLKKNGVVLSCVQQLAFGVSQAPLRLYRQRPGGMGGEPYTANPLAELLQRPNRQISQTRLLELTMEHMALAGYACWYKVRTRGGKILRFDPMNPEDVTPISGGAKLLSHYEVTDAEGQMQKVAPEDIVFFSWLSDPLEPWRGFPPLAAVASHVDIDNDLARYLKVLLKNDAIPRIALTIPDPLSDPVNDRARLRAEWMAKHSGENMGGVAVLDGGMKVERLGMNLGELAYTALHEVPEARICAALDVPPAIVGVNVALENMTYSNLDGMRRMFAEHTLAHWWASIAGTLTEALRDDFDLGNDLVCRFDTSEVVALAGQEKERRAWVLETAKLGLIRRNEARTMLGLKEDADEGNVYLAGPKSGEDLAMAEEAPSGTSSPTQRGPGQDEPGQNSDEAPKALSVPSIVEITDEMIDEATQAWDESMPDYAGLLDAARA